MEFSSTIHLRHRVTSLHQLFSKYNCNGRIGKRACAFLGLTSSGRRIKFDAEIQRGAFFIGNGESPKLMESEPCFLSISTAFTPHHSLRQFVVNARHDQVDDCSYDELMKCVNGAMLDPMVEVDPVTIYKQLQAEKEAMLLHNGRKNLVVQDVCTSVNGTSLCNMFQTFTGFHVTVFLAVTTLIIFLIETVRKTKMLDKSWHSNVGTADSFAHLDCIKEIGKRKEVVPETVRATQGNVAATAEWPAAEQGVVEKYRLTKRSHRKRWVDQTELNHGHIYSSESESHSNGTSFHSNIPIPPSLLPAFSDLPSKEAWESQIGGSVPLKSMDSPCSLPGNGLSGFCPSKRLDNSVKKGSTLFPSPSSTQRYAEKPIKTMEERTAHQIESSMLLPHQPMQDGDAVIDFLGDGQNSVEPTQDSSVKDPEIIQKEAFANSFQTALPTLVVGVGAVGSLTGVGRGLQVIGFAATLSLISCELLWAQTREQLWQDLKVISDRRKLLEFLKKRKIVWDV
eukprot:c25048_g1_i1 orf=294-1820(+)